ncbi:unnamed protein product, partial [Vitis vinifera]|uniref:Uncharacterized protein n=1 Tax=Vitis vinifera TaxID=29760 RepID=D7TRM0_VITVI
MWVFYLISLPLTLGMVVLTLKYFAGPGIPRYVFFTVGYAWFCSLSIIIIVPADIWTAITEHPNGVISFFWSWSYWSTFLLTWYVMDELIYRLLFVFLILVCTLFSCYAQDDSVWVCFETSSRMNELCSQF